MLFVIQLPVKSDLQGKVSVTILSRGLRASQKAYKWISSSKMQNFQKWNEWQAFNSSLMIFRHWLCVCVCWEGWGGGFVFFSQWASNKTNFVCHSKSTLVFIGQNLLNITFVACICSLSSWIIFLHYSVFSCDNCFVCFLSNACVCVNV